MYILWCWNRCGLSRASEAERGRQQRRAVDVRMVKYRTHHGDGSRCLAMLKGLGGESIPVGS